MSYTVNDVYNKALVFIGDLNDPLGNTDYHSRAPYIIASFCSNTKSLDKAIRRASNLGSTPSFSPVCIPILEQFPLCDELIHSAALYLASMLVIDDDEDLSEKLFDQYCDCLATLAASLDGGSGSALSTNSATCESISEKYFFD